MRSDQFPNLGSALSNQATNFPVKTQPKALVHIFSTIYFIFKISNFCMDGGPQLKLLLNPMDRVSEILFGLIMALSFTCSIGVSNRGPTEIRQLLIGAIGCNLAWGIVDATMYLIGVLAKKSRRKTIFDAVQNPSQKDEARNYISEELPSAIVSAIGTKGLEEIRNKLTTIPDTSIDVRLTLDNVKEAIAIFFLIFISTFPVVIPFVFIRDSQLALRISNLVAIVMMFFCGWDVAKYVGYNKWKMSTAIVLIGMTLVAVTIALGG
jgi:VIT1/CCC1 family predicted Fe2+/Mn2+ transporter